MLQLKIRQLLTTGVLACSFLSASALGATLDAYHDDLVGLQALPVYIWFVLAFCSILGAAGAVCLRLISQIENLGEDFVIKRKTLLIYIAGTVVLGVIGGVTGVLLGFALEWSWVWVCLLALLGGFSGERFIELVMSVVQGKARLTIEGEGSEKNN